MTEPDVAVDPRPMTFVHPSTPSTTTTSGLVQMMFIIPQAWSACPSVPRIKTARPLWPAGEDQGLPSSRKGHPVIYAVFAAASQERWEAASRTF